jgi:hypothetical protein
MERLCSHLAGVEAADSALKGGGFTVLVSPSLHCHYQPQPSEGVPLPSAMVARPVQLTAQFDVEV